MLRLIYNGSEVQLSADAVVEYYRDNPFFSKEGGYSLDIDIDLDNKVNARIFAGVKRFNLRSFRTIGSVSLFDGVHFICKGSASILSKDDHVLKLQILSDNSELNYIAKGSDRVRDLDLGSAVYDRTEILEDINSFYPNKTFVFPNIQFYNGDGFYDGLNVYGNVNLGQFGYNSVRSRLSPQPFLLHVISLIVDALGYRFQQDFIADDPRWQRLVMVNPYLTDEYSRMLPDWTVSDMLTELERFFNALFIVDSFTMNASFVSLNNWYDTADKVVIDDEVLDSFDITFNDDSTAKVLQSSNDNIGYEGLDNMFWKAAKLPDTFLSKLERSQTVLDYQSFNYYHDSKTNRKAKQFGTDETQLRRLYQLGQYQPFVDNPEHEEVSLRIFPAEIVNTSGFLVPCVPSLNMADTTQQFWDVVRDGQSVDETRNYMNVAFYIGGQYAKTGFDTVDSRFLAPCCITDYTSVFSYNAPFVRYAPNAFTGNDESLTLELKGPNGRGIRDFRNNISIDDTRLFTVRFISPVLPDPMKIYVIKGRMFICRRLRCTYTNRSSDKRIVTGEFYPML